MDTLKLKRALEEEEFNKASLQRKLTALEGELSAKQTEVVGLKTSVAELSSSRAAVEASLAGTKLELEAARAQLHALTKSSQINENQTLTETETHLQIGSFSIKKTRNEDDHRTSKYSFQSATISQNIRKILRYN